MRLEDYFDFLGPDDIRVKGTRIGIETILYAFMHQGLGPAEIAERYSSLALEQVYAAVTYYLHNKEAMCTYLGEWLEHGRNMRAEQDRNPPPVVLRLRQIAAERRAASHAAG